MIESSGEYILEKCKDSEIDSVQKASVLPGITYCTNIHPGESWQEIFAAVSQYAPIVKDRVAPESPFPLGLRLSGRAADEMSNEDARLFAGWCQEEGLYVRTVNGFPYGTFHHVPVKESVYLPDWRFVERLEYTKKLAKLMSIWLPEGMTGSISSVPVGFRTAIAPNDYPEIERHLQQALDFLDDLSQKTGQKILLSLEPEPGCVLETIPDVLDFFSRIDLTLSQRSFLAICFDCCHHALQYEKPADSLQLLADNDINIGNVQISSALRLEHHDIGQLKRFQESCYLHQAVGRKSNGELMRYQDLDQAIRDASTDFEEWRVHFHVPVFMDQAGDCGSTRFFLEEILPLFPSEIPLEVETYTWTVLPPDLRRGTVIDSIVREIKWAEQARSTR